MDGGDSWQLLREPSSREKPTPLRVIAPAAEPGANHSGGPYRPSEVAQRLAVANAPAAWMVFLGREDGVYASIIPRPC
jgi:hypothetical protein